MKPIRINIATLRYPRHGIGELILLFSAACVIFASFQNVRLAFHYKEQIGLYTSKTQKIAKDLASKGADRKKKGSGRVAGADDARIFTEIALADAYPWDYLLDSFERQIPSGVIISGFFPAKGSGKLSIGGRARFMNDLSRFIKNMENSGTFKDNRLLNIDILKGEPGPGDPGTARPAGISFEFECRYQLDPAGIYKSRDSSGEK